MKKVFLFIAAAALTLAACNKPTYVIPVDNDGGEKVDPTPEDEGYKEKTFVVNVVLKDGVSNTYDGVTAAMPGDDILDFLGLTEAEFYAGMGTYTGSTYPDPQSSQVDNTIMFGLAIANNTEDLKWIPSSCNNFGHWMTKDGGLCAWGDDAVFFVENQAEWGLDTPDENMWNFTVGAFPGRTAAGETYKGTQVFFYTDDDDVELYAYVQWNITIEKAEEVSLNVVKTEEVVFESEFNDTYIHTPIEISDADLTAAIGVGVADAVVYGVNADGSFSLAPGKNFWFSAEEGNVSVWGDGAGICINDDDGDGVYAWCMFPDESLGGKSLKGAIAFVNPDTMNAYVVKVTVNVNGIDYLAISTLVSYEIGETEYILSESNLAALAAALGVESVSADEIGSTYALKGINSDGSVYGGDFTANNGFWYTLAGDVTDWTGVEAAGYVGAYIEYRGDYTFGCGLWEEPGVTSTVKLGIGDAILTFYLEVDEPAVFETVEVGTMAAGAAQKIDAGYGGEVLVLDYDSICSALGLTDADFEEKFKIVATDGTVEYTGELPGGFWFNTKNEICSWGDVDSAYYLNFKYGEALEDDTDGKLKLYTGIRNDNSKDESDNVTHTCPPAGTYTAVVRMANIETLKHITLTVTLTIE